MIKMSPDPKSEHINARNDMMYFMGICESISKLSSQKYAELRTWLLMQPTIVDWKKLMKS